MDVTFGRSVVLVEDHDAALDFYCGLLGFGVIHDSELGGYRYLHVGPHAQPNVGLWLMTPVDEAQRQAMGQQTGNGPFLVLYVADLTALTDRPLSRSGPNRKTRGASLCTFGIRSGTCSLPSS